MNETEIYLLLDRLRTNFLETKPVSLDDYCCNVEVEGREFVQTAWKDIYGNDNLVIFELKTDNFLSSSHYCIGVRLNKDGSFDTLGNEQLWEIGIP